MCTIWPGMILLLDREFGEVFIRLAAVTVKTSLPVGTPRAGCGCWPPPRLSRAHRLVRLV